MQLGMDVLLNDASKRKALAGKRVALLGHPASVTSSIDHSLDRLAACPDIKLSGAFGPQHGMRGDKQDNMIESSDYDDPDLGIPVFSLYGDTRRPTGAMMDAFDVLLCDVQDIGCRIYTYITTLLYMLEACAGQGKAVWVLDRPNPAGRAMEGALLAPGWESFVGAGAILMRHGLTMGEMAKWFVKYHDLDVDLHVVPMEGYDPLASPGYGWPPELAWVNPSPNASSVNMTRVFAGSVLFEGTTLSEGRGTTVPLEVVGAPDIDIKGIMRKMHDMAPQWLDGVKLRPCFFEPTFHKHQGAMCRGFQVHTDYAGYQPALFKPYRLMSLFLKALRLTHPDYAIWRQHGYEYEFDRMPIDLINGGDFLRLWVDDDSAAIDQLENRFSADEKQWREEVRPLLLYPAST